MTNKTLLMLRHAKSSWDQPGLDDHDRPLNGRGRKAATRIGRLLNEQSFNVGLVLCSTSVRTRETAKLVFAEVPNPPEVMFRSDLYHATAVEITLILCQVAEESQCVMLIGHNPGFEDFVSKLTGETVLFPTGGLARVDLDLKLWAAFDDQTRGRLTHFWRPKEIDAS